MRFHCAGCSTYQVTIEAKKNGKMIEVEKIEVVQRAMDKTMLEGSWDTSAEEAPAGKICVMCNHEFPPTAKYFDRNKTSRDGLRSECKACRRIKQKAQKIKERDILREARKARKQKAPEPVQAPKSARGTTLQGRDGFGEIIQKIERIRQECLQDAEACAVVIKILQGE